MNRSPSIGNHRASLDDGLPDAVDGFSRRRIAFAVVIGTSGELLAIEDLLNYPFRNHRETRMAVPCHHDYTGRSCAQFLWGKTGDALGVRRSPLAEPKYKIDRRAFENFREFQLGVIQGMSDYALDAFLKFLKAWSPEDAFNIPDFDRLIDVNVGFRFRYDDTLLHQQPAARLAWQRSRARGLPQAGAA